MQDLVLTQLWQESIIACKEQRVTGRRNLPNVPVRDTRVLPSNPEHLVAELLQLSYNLTRDVFVGDNVRYDHITSLFASREGN